MMNMTPTSRTAGLIGGMSWRTTSYYYEEINRRIASRLGGIHSANLLIRSIDYADVASMVKQNDFDRMTDLLCQRGLELKAAGAESLSLCANVAHLAADRLEQETNLPVLHVLDFVGRKIIDSTIDDSPHDKLRKVGLLGTRAVMEQDFYKARLRHKFGLEVFIPDRDFRNKADELIFDELSKEPVVPENAVVECRNAYEKLVEDYDVDCVVLACTEFRLVFDVERMPLPTFDSTVLHARGIADWMVD